MFFRDEQIYQFNLLPEAGHRRPAFINLQQYWVDNFWSNAAQCCTQAELRWQNKIIGVTPGPIASPPASPRPKGIHLLHRLADRRRRARSRSVRYWASK